MSHYCVAVFSKTSDDESFDKLLHPYSETDTALFEFIPITEEEIEKRWISFSRFNPQWTKKSFLEQNGYIIKEVDGKLTYGYMANPKAKWDWYTLDGREADFFVKENERYDDENCRYRVRQMKWFSNPTKTQIEELKQEYKRYARYGDGFYNSKYYTMRFGSEDQYVNEMLRQVPYAFITPEGEWVAPGDVLWFAASNETAESANEFWSKWQAFIKANPDCYVSFVDCHV